MLIATDNTPKLWAIISDELASMGRTYSVVFMGLDDTVRRLEDAKIDMNNAPQLKRRFLVKMAATPRVLEKPSKLKAR